MPSAAPIIQLFIARGAAQPAIGAGAIIGRQPAAAIDSHDHTLLVVVAHGVGASPTQELVICILVGVSAPDPPHVLKSTRVAWATSTGFVLFLAGIGAALVVWAFVPLPPWVPISTGAAGCALGAWRGGRVDVRVDPVGVLIRNPWRTWSLAWSEIADVGYRSSNSLQGACLPTVLTHSGRRIGICSLPLLWESAPPWKRRPLGFQHPHDAEVRKLVNRMRRRIRRGGDAPTFTNVDSWIEGWLVDHPVIAVPTMGIAGSLASARFVPIGVAVVVGAMVSAAYLTLVHAGRRR